MQRKYILITGASRGIGKACALTFGHLGWYVFINCKSSPKELLEVSKKIIAEGGACKVLLGDIGKSADVTAMFSSIHEETGCLDVLVNNAGVSHMGLLSHMSDTDWEQVIQTNLSSVFYCCRAAIPNMVSKKSGKIINISSIWGISGASCEAAYSASKAGVNGLTKALAKELAPSNIQVNSIACGVIDTAMNACLSYEEKQALLQEIPSGRFGSPQEVADLVLTLAHGHNYLTGQVIGLDGGFL